MPPKAPSIPLEPITARISEEAARRLRVAAALENATTGQVLDRLILEALPAIESMVGQAWDYNRRKPFVPEPKDRE
jgi:uncharacterized protein (DUF1778 family)